MLYSYARIQAILRKVEELGINLNENVDVKAENKFEKILSTHLLTFPISVLKAAETFKPNLIADYFIWLVKEIK